MRGNASWVEEKLREFGALSLCVWRDAEEEEEEQEEEEERGMRGLGGFAGQRKMEKPNVGLTLSLIHI